MALNLVTGGCGFIGTHLVRLLRQRGEDVRVLDRTAPAWPVEAVAYRRGTITDIDTVSEAVTGCRRVFHLAALSGLWHPDKAAFIALNRDGTRNVLEACRSAGVETVVHTSTDAVLIAMGRGRRPQRINEQTRCTLDEMAGAYCRSKYLAEHEAWRAAQSGQRVIVVSPAAPAGPGDPWITPPTRMMLGFLNGAYPAYLESTLNLVDARDVAEGLWLAAGAGEPGRRCILAAHDVGMSGLLALLGAQVGRDLVVRRLPYPVALAFSAVNELLSDWLTHSSPAAPLAGVRLAGVPATFDNSETRNSLGWRPRPFADTLRDAVNDYRERGLI